MKKIGTSLLLAVASIAYAGETLHPADASDIVFAAKQAVIKELVKAGEPVKKGEMYVVDVTVNGKKCSVAVKPHMPSAIEPPVRWKAEPAVCK